MNTNKSKKIFIYIFCIFTAKILNKTINKTKEKEENKNNKLIQIHNKDIKNDNLPFRKLNLKKYNPNSLIQKYRNSNTNRKIFNKNRLLEADKVSKCLINNKIINDKTFKKENIIKLDSIHNSKINSLKHCCINGNYQTHLMGTKKTKKLQQNKNNTIRKNLLPKPMKNDKNFFKRYASSSVYIPSRKSNANQKSNLKEFRLGLLSAGSTSYNNVIIPMMSLTRQPSGYFNESENEKSSGNEDNKNRNNYMTYRKKNIVSGGILQRNKKLRNFSSYSKKEEYKDVEKLIPKFHKIKIEKGMMDSKLTKTLRDNFVSNYYKNRKYQIRNRLRFLKSSNNREIIKNIYNDIDF